MSQRAAAVHSMSVHPIVPTGIAQCAGPIRVASRGLMPAEWEAQKHARQFSASAGCTGLAHARQVQLTPVQRHRLLT